MKSLTKKLAVTGFAAALGLLPVLSTPSAHAAAQSQVTFQLNSKTYSNQSGQHTLAAAPFTLRGTTMVPLRALTESLSVKVSWNAAKQTTTLSGSFGELSFKVNDQYAVDKQGVKHKLAERVIIKNGTTFVPLRDLAQAMGAVVSWNAKTQSITIASGASGAVKATQFSYNFEQGLEGWTGSFADYPVDYNKDIYNLSFARELLPLGKDSKLNYGLKLLGNNRSDDLFMFLTKKVSGLPANTTYNAKLQFTMYTNEAGGMMGIGGAPAESVFIKAGVLSQEPKAVTAKSDKGQVYTLNVDKGNQGTEGKDIKNVGNAMKPDAEKEGFQAVKFTYEAKVTTNAKGEAFLLIGSDSGYEGLTTLYFDDISLSLTK